MPAYSESKVYKMVNSVDNQIYIGSTTQPLSKRLGQHKTDSLKKKPLCVHLHFNTIGWETVRIILIENVECFNREQLLMREQHYINLLNPSLNKRPAYNHNCPHNIKINHCLHCNICLHNIIKAQCMICRPLCPHNKQKERCKDCSSSYCKYCDVNLWNCNYKIHMKSKIHLYNFIYS